MHRNSNTQAPVPAAYYGQTSPLPETIALHAGPLNLWYEKGVIRYVMLGEDEIIRMIYPAVRDQNWGTVNPVIVKEEIHKNDHSFNITLHCIYRQSDIDFTAICEIRGLTNGSVVYSMMGEANSNFKKNRIGLCVLHPLKECAGRECFITNQQGEPQLTRFPGNITPHQPMKNIASIQWVVNDYCHSHLQFKGDVFEMEDHRNWTDASFKTYGTPLELPFPVEIKKGFIMEQSVILRINSDITNDNPTMADKIPVIDFAHSGLPLPKLGTGSSPFGLLTTGQLKNVLKLALDHYRVEIRLYDADWQKLLKEKANEAFKLNLPMELVLWVNDETDGNWDDFFIYAGSVASHICRIILFHPNYKTTPSELLQKARDTIAAGKWKLSLGGGTDAYFAELNRERPDSSLMDFVVFTINPQVHASDNRSLIETFESYHWFAESVKDYFGNIPLIISPITLKPRSNPNATSESPQPGPSELPPRADVRQMSLFGASWIMGCVKSLALAGVSSATLFEATGLCGLMDSAEVDPYRERFKAEKGNLYPLYHVLREILDMKNGRILPSFSPDPYHWELLVMKSKNKLKVMVANLTGKPGVFTIPLLPGKYSRLILDEYTLPLIQPNPEALREGRMFSDFKEGYMILEMKPYALAIVQGITEQE